MKNKKVKKNEDKTKKMENNKKVRYKK